MKEIDGRTRYWVPKEKVKKGKSEKNDKTVIFMVYYLGQCGCGFEREVTRKIELKENQTLDDLHEAIIFDSFKWDEEHMYSFFFDNIPYSKNRKKEYSCHPESNFGGEKPKSSNIKLKDLNLRKNQKFLFVFDFGDDHQFGIQVEGFGKIQKGKKYPLILKEKGKAPEQYPDYEE